ncbi:MAG: transporter substrate-binding domain-containing protein, partial [Nitratireductor sp.]
LSLASLNPLGAARAQNVLIPNFWDPDTRYSKPDFSTLPRLKFLTTTGFPPFNFIDRKKRLTGFHIDLARAICVELGVLPKCQIQAVPWDKLKPSIQSGEAEAIIAGLDVTTENRAIFSFSKPFLTIPGRFITLSENKLKSPIYHSLFKKTVGVVEGSAHEMFFSSSFGERKYSTFPTRQSVFNALKSGSVDAVFTDALSSTFWLASKDADDCCSFSSGAFLSKEYFGNGLTIAVSKEQTELTMGFNYALKQINEKGIFAELYLKYFPLGLF